MYYEKNNSMGSLGFDPITVGTIGSGVGILANLGAQIFGAKSAASMQKLQQRTQLEQQNRADREAREMAIQAQMHAMQQIAYDDGTSRRNQQVLILAGVGAAGVLLAGIILYNATKR